MSEKYLYILQAGKQDLYKVGITKNLPQRVRSLQPGCPYKLVIVNAVEMEYAPKWETYLRWYLSKYKTPGGREWFKLSQVEVESICVMIQEGRKELPPEIQREEKADGAVGTYIKLSSEMRGRLTVIGEQHGHVRASISNRIVLSSVINWVLGVGADVIEKTMQSGEYGNDRATAQLEKA